MEHDTLGQYERPANSVAAIMWHGTNAEAVSDAVDATYVEKLGDVNNTLLLKTAKQELKVECQEFVVSTDTPGRFRVMGFFEFLRSYEMMDPPSPPSE